MKMWMMQLSPRFQLILIWWVLFIFSIHKNEKSIFASANRQFHGYGGTFLALAGKDSVVLATDSRFANPLSHSSHFLLGNYPRQIYKIGSKTLVGFYGLESHEFLLMNEVEQKLANQEDEYIDPENVAKVISSTLFNGKGYFLGPIVVGLNKNMIPYICSMDGIGAQTNSRNFAVVGSAQSGLLAICESLYQLDLDAEELVGLAERCLQLAFQRDVLSGGTIKIVTLKNGEIFMKEVEFKDI